MISYLLKCSMIMATLHRKNLCACFVFVFGIIILWHMSKTSERCTEESGVDGLTALNVLNERESDKSWVLTVSHTVLLKNSSLYEHAKEVGATSVSALPHREKHLPKSLLNSFTDESQQKDYTRNSLVGFKWTSVEQRDDADLSAQSIDSVKVDVFDKSIHRYDESQHETLRGISRNSSAAGLVNVVAMSLYGAESRYTAGALRNAYLVRQNFPGWQLWVFIESPSSSKYPAVPEDIVSQLISLGAQVHYVSPEDDFVPPMMWRFLVADDPAVDWFIVRDVDSRLTARDAAAVLASIQSAQAFHCVRDHPSHAAYPLSGGLWGARAPLLRMILRKSWATMMRGVAPGYLNDMNFLNSVIWPRVERHTYCVDSVSCDHWTHSFPFPVARRNYEHVGQVYDENDKPRTEDVRILKHSLENRRCIPQ